jgi:hypothetical protein
MTPDDIINETREYVCEISDWHKHAEHRQWEAIARELAEQLYFARAREELYKSGKSIHM